MSERQYHLRTLARFCLMTSSIVGHLEVINQGPDFFFHSAEVGNGIRAPSRANNIPNGSLDFNFHLLFSGQREIYFAIAYRLLGAPIHSKRYFKPRSLRNIAEPFGRGSTLYESSSVEEVRMNFSFVKQRRE